MKNIPVYSMKDGVINGGDLELPLHRNFGKVYLDILKQYGDKTALIDGVTGEKISFKEFIQQTFNTAASLLRMGVKKGEVVAICSENRIEFMVTVMAVIYIGAIANFINSVYSKDEIIHSTEISKPKYVFFSPTTYNKYYDILQSRGVISRYFIFGKATDGVNATCFEDLVKSNVDIDSVKAANVDESDTAIIVYSSGTTGLPKGVRWSHLGLIISALQPICTEENLTVLGIAPWTNTVGFIFTMEYIFFGKTNVFLARFNEELYLKTIERYKVGLLLAVPPLVVFLSKSTVVDAYDVSSIKIILCGGAPLESKVVLEAKNRLPNLQYFFQGYGMSEATGGIANEKNYSHKFGSVGRVVPGVIIKIVDIESRRILGPNKPGEVCVKGAALFAGYIGKDPGDDYDEDGFFKTGDVAYYDTDGYIYMVDRIKELIKYNSWQVAPSELEALLLQHPGVKDAAVIGIPDSSAGELPLAYIVKQQEANISEKEIVDYVAAKVSPWKKLRGGVRFIPVIPKNGSGKILRRELRTLFANSRSKL